ncbi:NACHT domain-containing protein [Nocardia australiensis]|uniref:NACHT domain-containing protein n=1 Tax=Nocardia australiensis TaxID=2887191 RepID=UPI001D137029|nr:NACHT domain-containing protein [Nocardia australiensis]
MRVGFTTTSRSRPAVAADVSNIAAYYDRLDRSLPRLVVLGEPGSGKTVAAIHLVLGLLGTRRGLADALRAVQPVPVRVNASGWDGTQDFSSWLTTRLGYDYPKLRPVLARKLVEDGLILPVIDGLDEMDTPDSQGSRGRALLDQLNTAWRSEPVVVVCRTTEFLQLSHLGADNGLHAAETVTLQPLSTDRIRRYLTNFRDDINPTSEAWSEVITHIATEPDGALATALHTPWMLSLAINALHPAGIARPAPGIADQLTSCTTPDALENLLFAAQIPAAVVGLKQKKQYRNYTDANVHAWMQSLARRLEQRRSTGRDGTGIRLDEIWEIAGTTRCRILHGLTVGIITIISFGLLFGLVSGTVIGVEYGIKHGMAKGIVYGLVHAIPSELMSGLMSAYALPLVSGLVVGLVKSPPATWMVWGVPERSRWPKLVSGLKRGLVVGLIFGVIFGVICAVKFGFDPQLAPHPVFWIVFGLLFGLVCGLLFGLVFGLVYGVVAGFKVDANSQLRVVVDERQLIYGDTRAAALIGLIFGLVAGLILMPVYSFYTGPAQGLAAGLAYGTMVGLMVGRAAGRFFAATLIFRSTKAFSVRPTVFLDWARRNGLLRVNGTAYQFRHETYRQWLLQQPSLE